MSISPTENDVQLCKAIAFTIAIDDAFTYGCNESCIPENPTKLRLSKAFSIKMPATIDSDLSFVYQYCGFQDWDTTMKIANVDFSTVKNRNTFLQQNEALFSVALAELRKYRNTEDFLTPYSYEIVREVLLELGGERMTETVKILDQSSKKDWN